MALFTNLTLRLRNISAFEPLPQDESEESSSTSKPYVDLKYIMEQTNTVSRKVLSSLKSNSTKFHSLVQSSKSISGSRSCIPVITSQANPYYRKYLSFSQLNNYFGEVVDCNPVQQEEDSVVDKFIRIIRIEDEEENPMGTFYNHPSLRRNDREEIRRKLAMGIDDEIPVRKSLQSRLQNGMNLQICFMNETANSDCESQCSDTESTRDQIEDSALLTFPPMNKNACDLKEENESSLHSNFFAKQAQLQAEARIALAQAKDMARIQMEIEKQAGRHSPVTDIVRDTFKKIGVFPNVKRRFSRHILTDMNVAQLQVIVNELHTQSEYLSEELVQYLLQRDDLHMEQDSMLVDIEDLTKHLSAKEKTFQFEKASLIMQDALSTVSESPRCRKK